MIRGCLSGGGLPVHDCIYMCLYLCTCMCVHVCACVILYHCYQQCGNSWRLGGAGSCAAMHVPLLVHVP